MKTKISPGEKYVIPMHGNSVVEVESVDAAFVKFFVVEGPDLYKIMPLFVPLKETRRWKKVPDQVAAPKGSVRIRFLKWLRSLKGNK